MGEGMQEGEFLRPVWTQLPLRGVMWRLRWILLKEREKKKERNTQVKNVTQVLLLQGSLYYFKHGKAVVQSVNLHVAVYILIYNY